VAARWQGLIALGGSPCVDGHQSIVLERHDRRIAPQRFEIIEGALVRLEDMDENPEVIEHDPLAGRKTVGVAGQSELVPQPFLHFRADGFEVRVARAGADDKIIGEAAELAQIEDANVFGFFVRGRLGGGQGDG